MGGGHGALLSLCCLRQNAFYEQNKIVNEFEQSRENYFYRPNFQQQQKLAISSDIHVLGVLASIDMA